MTAMLASVRDLAEANVVIKAGCDWLDLKDPGIGALGAVTLTTVRDIVRCHAGALPISATIGDCWGTPEVIPARVENLARLGIEYVKVGVFARDLASDFAPHLKHAVSLVPNLIAVCFAEDPPSAVDVAQLAALGLRGVMLDTADKAHGSLPSLLAPLQIREFVVAAREHGLLVGLAGSLRRQDIPALLTYGADYLGFRGALCRGHAREDTIDPQAVHEIRGLLTNPSRLEKERNHGVART